MHWHSLPAARGCAVGRPRRRAAAHPPLRPPTLAYSPICPPRSSRSSEPPEEVGHRSRGSRGGWAPDRRGCPGSRASRHPRRGGHPVAPQLNWAMMVVSWRLGAPRQLSAAAPMSTAPWRAHTQGGRVCAREGCSCPHPHRRERHRQGSQCAAISAGHLAKKEAFQRSLDTP